jgi:hypothetical protein
LQLLAPQGVTEGIVAGRVTFVAVAVLQFLEQVWAQILE